ncbi:unnamed protein product [Clonostachys byssicola]|uniref:Uncharacterized protein n=1 Tax=Clonostachys byssicola TaxID=160290 RepID=A0A9N9TY32_9HYPO|nr:unnamed protein product [Clonostachys byssicola]
MAFLTIPREIRLKILTFIICSPVDPPNSPLEAQRGRKELRQKAWLGYAWMASAIWQLPQSSSALSLLLVNKQVNVETRYVIEHAPTNYHVDVMFLKDYGLWTTWSIPALPRTQYIESVHATFRIFEPEGLKKRFKHSMDFGHTDIGPPWSSWSLYQMLMSLLRAGPGYIYSLRRWNYKRSATSQYIVRNIIIDILAPSDGAEHKSMMVNNEDYEERLEWLSDDIDDNNSVPMENRLATYMCNSLNTLLTLDYHSLNYGALVYEGVQDKIQVLVNGRPFKQFNIEEMGENISMQYFGESPDLIVERKEKYGKWKSWLCERRQRMKQGLELDGNRPVEKII